MEDGEQAREVIDAYKDILELHLLPKAKRLKLIDESATHASLVAAFKKSSEASTKAMLAEGDVLKRQVKSRLLTFALNLRVAEHLLQKDPSHKGVASAPFQLVMAGSWLGGMLEAMEMSRDVVQRRATNGRRLIGAQTRERVRAEALLVERGVSKDRAAAEIGSRVGKSFGYVQQLLTDLFPAEAWDRRHFDESPDPS